MKFPSWPRQGTHVTCRLFTRESRGTGQICEVTLSCCKVLPTGRSTCQSGSSATARPCSCDFLTFLCPVKEKEPFFSSRFWFYRCATAVYRAALPSRKNVHGTFSLNILPKLGRGLGTSGKDGLHPESINHPHLSASCLPGLWKEDGENLQTPHRKAPFWH